MHSEECTHAKWRRRYRPQFDSTAGDATRPRDQRWKLSTMMAHHNHRHHSMIRERVQHSTDIRSGPVWTENGPVEGTVSPVNRLHVKVPLKAIESHLVDSLINNFGGNVAFMTKSI